MLSPAQLLVMMIMLAPGSLVASYLFARAMMFELLVGAVVKWQKLLKSLQTTQEVATTQTP
jgi:hypothetical protein